MDYNDMDQAINEAELTIRRAQLYVDKMTSFLIGRLRKVRTSYLRQLKKELRNFNAVTGDWKD